MSRSTASPRYTGNTSVCPPPPWWSVFDLPGGPCFLKGAIVSQQHALHFWLEQGVAGFAICDTDAAYSEEVICFISPPPPLCQCPSWDVVFQTLLVWRSILKKFSEDEEERYSRPPEMTG